MIKELNNQFKYEVEDAFNISEQMKLDTSDELNPYIKGFVSVGVYKNNEYIDSQTREYEINYKGFKWVDTVDDYDINWKDVENTVNIAFTKHYQDYNKVNKLFKNMENKDNIKYEIIEKFNNLVADVLKCSKSDFEIYIFPYNSTDIDEIYSDYAKDKETRIRLYLKDCKDITNKATFEPFIRYFEEYDKFIEIDLDAISKYLTFDNIGDIIGNTGIYISKDKEFKE